jgi:methionine-rich copper-binding protein CopC
MTRKSGALCRSSMDWLLASVLSILLVPTTAVAHARLIRASPADGADVSGAPSELSLCFSELLERQFEVIELAPELAAEPSSRRSFTKIAATIDPRDEACLTADRASWSVAAASGGHSVAKVHRGAGGSDGVLVPRGDLGGSPAVQAPGPAAEPR